MPGDKRTEIFMSGNIDTIIDYWFGAIEDQLSPPEKYALWYNSKREDDKFIKDKFEHLYQQAMLGHLDSWLDSAKGTMALIILLDQMPRNMYRGEAQAFAGDHLALHHCLKGIEKGFDKQLQLVERCFFYHPLEHAEDIKMQELCVLQFQRLQQVYQGDKQQNFIRNSLDFAHKHLQIIEKYGRFPYRNSVLERESTVEEIEFLKTGVNFGQSSNK